MDTSARDPARRATVVIALLGMFATGVASLYGLAIAAVIAVLLSSSRRSRCCRAPLTFWASARAPTRLDRTGLVSPAPATGVDGAGRALMASRRTELRAGGQDGQGAPWPAITFMALMIPRCSVPVSRCDGQQRRPERFGEHQLTPCFDLLARALDRDSTGAAARSRAAAQQRHDRTTALRALVARRPGSSPSHSRGSRRRNSCLIERPRLGTPAVKTTNLVNHLRDDVLRHSIAGQASRSS